MDEAEAGAILATEVEKLRKRPYAELVRRLLGKQEKFEVAARRESATSMRLVALTPGSGLAMPHHKTRWPSAE